MLRNLPKRITRTTSELFSTRTEWLQAPASPEDGNKALLASLEPDTEADEEDQIRGYMERFRRWAQGTLGALQDPSKRRRHASDHELWKTLGRRAHEVLGKIDELDKAIKENRWFAAIHFAVNLERAIIEKDLIFKKAEPNAEMGREVPSDNRRERLAEAGGE
jgi:hypothetical protein